MVIFGHLRRKRRGHNASGFATHSKEATELATPPNDAPRYGVYGGWRQDSDTRYNGGMQRTFVIGMLAGWTLWVALYAAAHAVEASETYWPRLLRDADLPDTIGSALLVIALPVAAGGWLFVWGDGPQPPAWVTGVPFNVAVGLILWGTLGVLAMTVYTRLRKPKGRRGAGS